MSNALVPAPLWRRLCAAVYDGLVVLGLCMAALLVEMILRENLLGLPKNTLWLKLLLFCVGLGFFGWFWVNGGQTLGMRAWRLQVRRIDGASLRWPVAAVRYGAMLATWLVALMPALLAIPRYSATPSVQAAALACALASIGAAVLMRLESRRRAICDRIAATEVIVLPRDGSA